MRRVLTLFLCLVFLAVLCRPASAIGESMRLACILPSYYPESVFWRDITQSIRATADELEIELSLLYTRHSEPSLVLPLNDAISIATLSGVDAIIISYTIADADERTNALIVKAREAGIRVVMLDCDTSDEVRDAYVGIDNEAAGREIGQSALEALAPGKTALLIYSAERLTQANLSDRIAGIEQAFSSAPQRLVRYPIAGGIKLQTGLELSNDLAAHPEVGAIITIDEGGTLNVAQLLNRIDPQHAIRRYGFDESEETLALVESGALDMLICQPHEQLGREAVYAAYQLVLGETGDSPAHLIDYVTRRGE